MTITPRHLTRAAGLCAVAGGLLFAAVQIKHPHVDITFATTTEYAVRETVKSFMAVLSLIGITGLYLRQVKQTGVLGLIGFVLFGVGYLAILGVQVVGVVVLPRIAGSAPGYVSDVLAVAVNETPTGDIGLMGTLIHAGGISYLAGGFLFGVALFRAQVLARWAAALLAVGALSTLAIPLLPQINQRLFAIPVGLALACLGYLLWREQRTPTSPPLTSPVSPRLDPAGAR
jgi:hypothetical protein